MRRFAQALAGIVVAVGALALFVPSERALRQGPFTGDLSDPEAYLAAREAAFGDITPGVEARILWAAERGAETPVSVLFLHGFSATSEEIRPVPDNVAAHLGANLVFARLRGHGRDGEALAEATASDWIADTAEALAVARAVGDKVIVIGVSTGATLAAIAATEADMAQDIAGIAMVSANFRLAHPATRLLDWPGAELWAPWIAGAERSFEPQNEDHGRYWTTRYPTRATFSLAAVMRAARARDYTQVDIPLLMVYAREDQVVSAAALEAIAEVWGGPVQMAPQTLPDTDIDPFAHVIAGDILSPAMTEPVSRLIQDWATEILSSQ